jgi:hypothetical protein
MDPLATARGTVSLCLCGSLFWDKVFGMIRRRHSSDESRGKALDLWHPPDGAGEPLICLATTFTFDAAFFETECLGRFLQMDTHPQESDAVGYLIEREEKLASARVCVLADRRHAQARESLRWDLLPVAVPGACQHAKLSVLCWTNYVRIIIGSGNLTEPGYRKNLEVFGTLEASRKDGGSISEILGVIEFLEQLLELALGDIERRGPKQRAREVLTTLRLHIRGWPRPPRRAMRVVPIFSGIGSTAFDELRDIWPASSQPRAAHILSPFFDREDSTVFTALLDVLAKRQTRFIYFYFPYQDLPDGRTRIFAPRSLIDTARETSNLSVEKVLHEQDGEPRPLHAKMLVLSNDEWEVWLIGSSNFTRAGYGLSEGASNIEANLAYIVRVGEAGYGKLQDVWPELVADKVDLKNQNIVWEPVFEADGEGEADIVLPVAFREALYDGTGESSCLILSLGDDLPERWWIRIENDELLNSESWQGNTGEYIVLWQGRPVPLALTVEWESGEDSHVAGWPINVIEPALLLPPEALRGLSLEELMGILSSSHPLHIAVIQALNRRISRSSAELYLDPHRRVNMEAFLLQRTRRVALALERLRERLERPVVNMDSLDWRLRGPVGPLALAEAFRREARAPGEARFFLAELALVLKRIRAERAAAGGLSQKAIRERILEFIIEIERMAESIGSGGGALMDRYIMESFQEARR